MWVCQMMHPMHPHMPPHHPATQPNSARALCAAVLPVLPVLGACVAALVHCAGGGAAHLRWPLQRRSEALRRLQHRHLWTLGAVQLQVRALLPLGVRHGLQLAAHLRSLIRRARGATGLQGRCTLLLKSREGWMSAAAAARAAAGSRHRARPQNPSRHEADFSRKLRRRACVLACSSTPWVMWGWDDGARGGAWPAQAVECSFRPAGKNCTGRSAADVHATRSVAGTSAADWPVNMARVTWCMAHEQGGCHRMA